MKTLKKVQITHKMVDIMPEKNDMEEAVLYVSEKYGGINHLCLCGCGEEAYLPIGNDGWQYTIKNDKLSLTPSVLQRFECKSHYIITNGVANFV